MKIPDIQQFGSMGIEGGGSYRLLMVAEEQLGELAAKSYSATPGPWLREWASFEVRALTGGALQTQADIDFAVAACAFVRDILEARKP